MTTLRITLSEKQMAQLQEKAKRYQIAPEELLRMSLEELLTRPDEDFQQAMEHVLTKNAELYRRLAMD